ncbi:MAG: zinc-dependent metalloprotease [Actinomycetia bacterium]|nr:zinc-dependent metalloprotease [Actinomycetes bacterium]
MSDLPFGFGPPGEGDDDGPGGPGAPQDPFAALFGAGGTQDIGAALQQLGRLLSNPGPGPVNWDLARDVARQAVAAAGDASVSAADARAVEDAVRLAEVWLDPVTALPAGTSGAVAWSRAEWVEGTLASWRRLVDPVAETVVTATTTAVPEEMRAMAGPMLGMVRQLGGAMFGTQVGQALGLLAGEVVGAADVGLPLGPAERAVLLPANVAAFGAGLGVPADEVRLYLALRECAHQRLFAHVSWLPAALFGAVEDYARGISVDTARIEEVMQSIDPQRPEAIQEALASGLFEPHDTPEQQVALSRLETLLALVEGWVDAVVTDAAGALPSAVALRETVRRARATGGPAEQTFATLVGLELRPRRLRDAAELWAQLRLARGVDGRDAVWEHPDLLPTADDLDDPQSFVARTPLDLSALESAGEAPPEPPAATDPPT